MNINIKELPNFTIDTNDEETIINETSFVENPATGFHFLKFSKSDIKEFKFSNLESKGHQRMVSGLWFAPDTKYIRNSGNMYYTVEFDKEDLKKSLLKYLKSDYANNTKVEHKGDYQDGFIAIEHWIYEGENTKSPVFGLTISDLGYDNSEIKEGSIFKTVFVQNESFWNDMVLTDKVNGFSIGGLFNMQEEKKALDQYFSKTSDIIEEEVVTAVVEDLDTVVEDLDTVVSADVNVLDEEVVVEEAELATLEQVIENIEVQSNEVVEESKVISELYNKFEELNAKLENYISENSLLKSENERYKLENALKEEVITKQTAHLKDSPIKPISHSKSAEVNVTPDKSKKGKWIGHIWVPID